MTTTESAAPSPALTVRGLTVDYRRRGVGGVGGRTLRAVDDLSFDLIPGRVLALVGESGSGKSTVVRTLAGFVAPSGGEIALDSLRGVHGGRRTAQTYRRALQTVFQDPFASLNPMHTVERHLARPLARQRGIRGRERLRAAVHELLGLVNLTPAADFAAKHPHELSGGQRQRVAIARALATEPRVLLADEPVSMLDVSIRLEILNLLDGLTRQRNLALLYVTHDLATARHFSENIMVMYRGRVVESGPADEVILNPAHPYTQMLATAAPDPTVPREQLAAARRARVEARANRDMSVPVESPGACNFIARCPYAKAVCVTAPDAFPAGEGHTARCWRLTEHYA